MIKYAKYLLVVFLLDYVEVTLQHCSMTSPCADQLGAGEAFQEPAQESSSHSSWRVNLHVDIGTLNYDWLELKRRLYNGQPSGPTITVKQGDSVTVVLTNDLTGEPGSVHYMQNGMHSPNVTNLHTHGLHISAEDPQDNVLITVNPETAYTYVYQIHPHNPPGTYWYHAHFHGSTLFHVNSGLAGILIVEDDPSEMPVELAAVSCPDNCEYDIQLLFQPHLIFGGFRGFAGIQDAIGDDEAFKNDQYILDDESTLTEWLESNVQYYTTNGLLEPVLDMITGQMYRFRMVQSGGDGTLEVYITDSDGKATSNCEIREIAYDGVYLTEPRTLHDGQTFLVSGSKVDWLVKCTVPGTYKLTSFPDRANNLSIGSITRFNGTLVTLKVSGGWVSSSFPDHLPDRPDFLEDLRDVPDEDIEGRFVLELGPLHHLNRDRWSNGTYYRYKMTVGHIQEWHLLNTDTRFSHPLHIHVNHFQVISYNNYTGGVGSENSTEDTWKLTHIDDQSKRCYYQYADYNAQNQIPLIPDEERLRYLGHNERFEEDNGGTLGYSRVGDWRDLILVPPLSNITIRFYPDEFTCDVIIHCHLLGHEDDGMMVIVKIVAEGESTEANVKSGNAYPGTCKRCDRYPFNNPDTLCDVEERKRLIYRGSENLPEKLLLRWMLLHNIVLNDRNFFRHEVLGLDDYNNDDDYLD